VVVPSVLLGCGCCVDPWVLVVVLVGLSAALGLDGGGGGAAAAAAAWRGD